METVNGMLYGQLRVSKAARINFSPSCDAIRTGSIDQLLVDFVCYVTHATPHGSNKSRTDMDQHSTSHTARQKP